MTQSESAVSTSEFVIVAANMPNIRDTKANPENINPSFI